MASAQECRRYVVQRALLWPKPPQRRKAVRVFKWRGRGASWQKSLQIQPRGSFLRRAPRPSWRLGLKNHHLPLSHGNDWGGYRICLCHLTYRGGSRE